MTKLSGNLKIVIFWNTLSVDADGLETVCGDDLGLCDDAPTKHYVEDLATEAIDFKTEFIKAFTNMIEYGDDDLTPVG